MREMRAICSHQFEAILLGDFKPENVDIMIDEIAAANFNAIQLCVRAPGILYYPSAHGPVHQYCRTYDLLDAVISKAHRAGLEFHSYFPVFLEGGWRGAEYQFDPDGGMFAAHPEWRTMVFEDGELVPTCFACPSHESYVDYVNLLVEEQCAVYDLDLFIMDFIRFNKRCFCPRCKEGYREMFGEELCYDNVQYCDTYVPPDVPGELEIEYRCQVVERAAKRLLETIRQCGRNIKVGAYTFPGPKTASYRVFQDRTRLASNLDALFPMYYDSYSIDNLKGLLPLHRQALDCPLIPGLITMREPAVCQGRGDAAYFCGFLEQIRRAGCEGFFVFNYEVLFGRPPGQSLGKIIRPPQASDVLQAIKEQFLQKPATSIFRQEGVE